MLMMIAGLLASLALQPTDTTVPVRPGMRLQMDNFDGNITVTAWNRSAVRIQAEDDDDEGNVDIRLSERTLSVNGGGRHGPSSTDFRLTVPAGMDLELSTKSGDISVDGVKGEVSVESVDGNITVSGGVGLISLHSVEGEITLSGARGRMDLNAVDGNIRVSDGVGEIHAETVDGEITLEDVDAPAAEATSVDGNIEYRGTIKDGGRYHFNSHDGNVTVTTPELNAAVSVSTFSGDFQSDFPVTLTGRTSSKRMSFTLGNGSARLELESFDGMIALRKGSKR